MTRQCLCRRATLNSFINLGARVWRLVGIWWRRSAGTLSALWFWLALFRTAEGSKRHCAHVRKGHREKWRTAANCLSGPLLLFLTTICYPVWHVGGPVWTTGFDLGQEQVNLVSALSSSQHNLFLCLLDLLRWKRKWSYLQCLQCLTFDCIITQVWHLIYEYEKIPVSWFYSRNPEAVYFFCVCFFCF